MIYRKNTSSTPKEMRKNWIFFRNYATGKIKKQKLYFPFIMNLIPLKYNEKNGSFWIPELMWRKNPLKWNFVHNKAGSAYLKSSSKDQRYDFVTKIFLQQM